MRYLRTLINPRPSFFDICASLFAFMPWIKTDFARSQFIVFYTIFLMCLSFSMKANREYKSLPLTFLSIWTLLGLFIHSYAIYPRSLTYQYKLYYLMVEGFLYVFFGIMLIRTIVKYSTNLKFALFLIPIGLIPWYSGLAYFGKSTYIVAFGISVIIYLFLKKNYRAAILASTLSALFVIWKWSWLTMKFRCRPYIWYQLLVNSFYHPMRKDAVNILDPGIEFSPFIEKFIESHQWIANIKPWLQSVFGSGFSQYLNSDYTWVDTTIWNKLGHHKTYTFGWVHNQNDYLHFAQCLGPIGLGLLIWFIVQSCKTIGVRPILILFMTVLLVCFGQLTMFNPGMAGICLLIVAISITEGLKGRKV